MEDTSHKVSPEMNYPRSGFYFPPSYQVLPDQELGAQTIVREEGATEERHQAHQGTVGQPQREQASGEGGEEGTPAGERKEEAGESKEVGSGADNQESCQVEAHQEETVEDD